MLVLIWVIWQKYKKYRNCSEFIHSGISMYIGLIVWNKRFFFLDDLISQGRVENYIFQSSNPTTIFLKKKNWQIVHLHWIQTE